MAINNGNSDFGLKVSKTGTKSLSISWSKSGGIGYGGSIQVQRPGDGKIIFSKDYSQATAKDSITVETPYFGEYKVHIKANNGYTYDTAYCKVHLATTTSATYEFTAKDVLNWKINATFTLGSFALLGFASLLVVSVTTTVISLGATIRGVWVHDTKYEPFPTPRAGDKIITKIEPATDGVRTTISFKAKNGGVYQDKITTAKYLTYTR
ncbi:hypothetical protein [Lysinibacillus sp. NPDC059133]|uniref:hypothetical protein n=1 Tax=Lysinibacillus sp. NPDC059133 TaxID=3346737 RepID=UPI003689133C